MAQFSKKQMDDIADGLKQSSREFVPRPRVLKCGTCKKFKPATDGPLTCSKYPSGIPSEILRERENCEAFQQK